MLGGIREEEHVDIILKGNFPPQVILGVDNNATYGLTMCLSYTDVFIGGTRWLGTTLKQKGRRQCSSIFTFFGL